MFTAAQFTIAKWSSPFDLPSKLSFTVSFRTAAQWPRCFHSFMVLLFKALLANFSLQLEPSPASSKPMSSGEEAALASSQLHIAVLAAGVILGLKVLCFTMCFSTWDNVMVLQINVSQCMCPPECTLWKRNFVHSGSDLKKNLSIGLFVNATFLH